MTEVTLSVEFVSGDGLLASTPFQKLGIKVGRFCIIEAGVTIGRGTVIGDYVKLKSGTKIGRNCRLDDYVNTSGYCKIGNGVTIKRCTMIGQATEIDEGAWIGSCVTTTRIKNPLTENPKELWIRIGKGAMVGSRALLLAGITIGRGAVIGAGAVVAKDCPPETTWIGPRATLHGSKSNGKTK
jgi:acetyltransferase-like isoleucine patch superfamily enzyme